MSARFSVPDFNRLLALHKQDPLAFEAARRGILRQAVDEAPAAYRPGLEQLLERIEAVRNEARSPEDAMEKSFEMMCDSLERLNSAWDDMCTATAEWQAAVLIEQARVRSVRP